MGGRPNFYLFPFWAYLDEVKWTYLVIPISSIKGESDGQEGPQHHYLLGKSFSCTKTSQQSVNILQYLIFSFCLEKRWDRGKIKFRSVPLLSLSWWSLANIPCDSNLINQRQAKWSRRSTTPLPSRELFLLHKDKSTISDVLQYIDFQLLAGIGLGLGANQIFIWPPLSISR